MNFTSENQNHQRPWLRFYGENTPADLDYTEETLYGVLRETAERCAKLTAIDYMNVSISYRTLLEEVNICMAALRELGIAKGDRVTICLPNIPQAVILFYAVVGIGAVANFIHPLSASTEIQYAIQLSRSNCVFLLDAFYSKMQQVSCPTLRYSITAGAADYLPWPLRAGFFVKEGRKIPPVREDGRTLKWQTFRNRGFRGRNRIDLEDKSTSCTDAAVILYSGGTTGKQKGILLSHLNFNALAAQTVAMGAPSFRQGDSMLAVLPLFHGFGLGVCIHTCVTVGAVMILVPRFNADSFARLIIRKKPSFMAGVPTLYEALLRNGRLEKADFRNAKGVFSGGDKLPYDVKQRFDALLKEKGSPVPLREGFGLTECVTASALTPEREDRKGSVGIPYPDTFYKVVEPGTQREVAPGTDGEFCISGPSVMLGYLDDPQETAQALQVHDDGRTWLHTGDIGCMDADGFLYFKNRMKRMIKCSGYSVYPSQIEEVLNSHEAVSLSCVIGVKDDYKMHRLKAFVVLRDGVRADDALRKELLSFCARHVAKFSVPKELEFRTELPMTKVGKIAYTVLEEEESR